jgi:hypothetical protein
MAEAASESRCSRCKSVLYQCSECANLDKAIRRSMKPKQQDLITVAESDKQKLFLSLIYKQYVVRRIPRDGNCLFGSFVAAYEHLTKTRLTVTQVRERVADHLISEITSKGCISGQPYDFFEAQADGDFVLTGAFESVRGRAKKGKTTKVNVQQYAAKIRSGLYGGDMEVLLLANMFNLTINVYSWHFFDGVQSFAPQQFGSGPESISFLFEQCFLSQDGARDHYDLIVSEKFAKWRAYMNAMPIWNKDIALCHGRAGRGIKALRDFKKGDVLLQYDGHRVNERGEVVIERESVKKIYDFFSGSVDLSTFVKSHAVCLGRTHVTGLLIDGYPLTLPVFDEVEGLARGALANSGSPKDSNMKMVWVEAPDLPHDPIDHLRDCEAFLIARREILCVKSIHR